MNDMAIVGVNPFLGQPFDQLANKLGDLFQQMASFNAPLVYEAAQIYEAMKQAGEDLSAYRQVAMSFCLEEVAAGRVSATVVARLRGAVSVIRVVARLEVEEQMKLASMSTVKVARLVPGGPEIVDVPVEMITRADCMALVDDRLGRMRDPEEQLEYAKPKTVTRTRPVMKTKKVQLREDQNNWLIAHVEKFNRAHACNVTPEAMIRRWMVENGMPR